MGPAEYSHLEAVVAEKVRGLVSRQCLIDCRSVWLMNKSLTTVVEETARGLLVKLEADILALGSHQEHVSLEVEYPATWWQHFKKDLMPGWFLRLFPVVNTLHTMRESVQVFKAVCPHLSDSGQGSHVKFLYMMDRNMTFPPSKDIAI